MIQYEIKGIGGIKRAFDLVYSNYYIAMFDSGVLGRAFSDFFKLTVDSLHYFIRKKVKEWKRIHNIDVKQRLTPSQLKQAWNYARSQLRSGNYYYLIYNRTMDAISSIFFLMKCSKSLREHIQCSTIDLVVSELDEEITFSEELAELKLKKRKLSEEVMDLTGSQSVLENYYGEFLRTYLDELAYYIDEPDLTKKIDALEEDLEFLLDTFDIQVEDHTKFLQDPAILKIYNKMRKRDFSEADSLLCAIAVVMKDDYVLLTADRPLAEEVKRRGGSVIYF